MKVRRLIDRYRHTGPVLGLAVLAPFARRRRALRGRVAQERAQADDALQAARETTGGSQASDVSFRDALEEKEDQVRAQASRHKTIFQDTPVIMGAIDEQYRIVDVSAFCLAELGYARSEVVGRRITDFMAPATGARAMAKLLARSGAGGDAPRNVELAVLRKDGSVMEVLLSAAPEHDEEDGVVRHWWVMKDVTERNAMIREIRQREQLYSGVFNQTFQFVALVTPAGLVKEANRTLGAYTGRSQRELTGAAIWRLPGWSLEPESAAGLESALARAARGDFVQGELTGTGAAGEAAIVDFSLKPLRSVSGEVEVVIFEGRDVTAQRRQQEELHHARRMEAMGALTSGIAHDFNNLLTVIAGNLQLAETLAETDPRLQKRIGNAIGAVFRGQALTRQLLAFSHKQSLQPASIDANELMNSMEQIVETLGDDIRIDFDLADDLWRTWADPAQLETALLNLAINARDAMPEGGRIVFATRNARLEGSHLAGGRAPPPGEYVEIRISDTGLGMSADVLDHALEPFFTTKAVGQGTGLGLSTAYGFARQSGGTLEIDSAPGDGTTVRLYLPRSQAAAARPDVRGATPAPAVAPADEPRILLLEDDEGVREATATFLRQAGYRVEEAADADEAVAMLRSGRRYDLLFSDIVVPGAEDGYGVTRIARESRPDIGVLLCSAFRGRSRPPGDEEPEGNCEIVEKPYRHEDVLWRIARMLPEHAP